MMRIRTSSEYQVANVYGHLSADPKYEELFHVAGCDQRKTFAVDFEFMG